MAVFGHKEEEDQEKTWSYNCDVGSLGVQRGPRSLHKLKICPREESISLTGNVNVERSRPVSDLLCGPRFLRAGSYQGLGRGTISDQHQIMSLPLTSKDTLTELVLLFIVALPLL